MLTDCAAHQVGAGHQAGLDGRAHSPSEQGANHWLYATGDGDPCDGVVLADHKEDVDPCDGVVLADHEEDVISIQMGPMVGRAVTVLIEPSNAAHKVLSNIGDQLS